MFADRGAFRASVLGDASADPEKSGDDLLGDERGSNGSAGLADIEVTLDEAGAPQIEIWPY